MQFKHPEVLYALFLLLIPILIHLFQLRRFQKIDFTNVAFLKKVTIQTRKSSQLKKWLTLLFRLLAFGCIILAFAQPFTASKTALNAEKETVLYIDNSFSMQAKGSNGPLLNRALQELYDKVSGNSSISWFTNSETHRDVSVQDFKGEILKVPYSHIQLSPTEVLFKADQLFTNSQTAEKRLLFISDLQIKDPLPVIPQSFAVDVVQPKAVTSNNISIDTTYITSKDAATTKLTVRISAQGEIAGNVPVSLYKENGLVAKIGADLSQNRTTLVSFDLDASSGFKGKLEVNDSNLLYDNSLYFSINKPEKIKVLSINASNPDFINRLFNQPEFEYSQQAADNLNYNDLPDQNFVVLNEVGRIPPSLSTALRSFVNDGGSLLIIPSEEADLLSYNNMLNSLQLGTLSVLRTQEKKISQIVFEHPLYTSVFEKRVINFQHPKVNSYFPITSNAVAALRFEDSNPFVLQKDRVYLCLAAINTANSNFQSSPLIVPTIYNMAIQSLPLPTLYFENGRQNSFAVPVRLSQDEILRLRDSTSGFIPLQQTLANQVVLTTEDQPVLSGTYSVAKDTEEIALVSFNYDRSESKLQYSDADDWEGVNTYNNITAMFEKIAEDNSINSFWKWFVIFALLFLIFEMLVLKFYKN